MYFSTFLSILAAAFLAIGGVVGTPEGWHVKFADARTVAAAKERGLFRVVERQLPAAKAINEGPKLIELTHAASALGALASCTNSGLYDSPILRDSIARHVAIFQVNMKDGDKQSKGITQVWPSVFDHNKDAGIYRIPVTEGTGEGMRIASVIDVAMDSEAACKAVETDLKRWREPGGILDVAPPVPGQDA